MSARDECGDSHVQKPDLIPDQARRPTREDLHHCRSALEAADSALEPCCPEVIKLGEWGELLLQKELAKCAQYFGGPVKVARVAIAAARANIRARLLAYD